MTQVVVYGAGLIGCYLAGMIGASKRATVTLICRDSLRRAVEANGNNLHVTKCFDGAGKVVEKRTLNVPVTAGDQNRSSGSIHMISEPISEGGGLAGLKASGVKVDYLIITMKRKSVTVALEELRSVGFDSATKAKDGESWHWKDTTIVMVQNGIRPSEEVLNSLGSDLNVLEGMFPFNVANPDGNPAAFEQGSSGYLYITESTGGTLLANILNESGIETKTSANMESVQYGKLIMNLNNAVSALSGLPLKKELSMHGYRRVLSQCITEAMNVFAAAKIFPHSFMAIPYSAFATVVGSPDFVFNNISGLFLKISGTATSSMYEDIAANRTTEIDYLQGHIVKLGNQYGVRTPVCSRITELVKEVEAKKSGLIPHSPEQLL